MSVLLTMALAPITLVGVLTEQGVRECKDGVERWVSTHYEVGFSPVTFSGPPPSELLKQPVVVIGEPAAPPKRPLVANDLSCPPMQARMDWVPSLGGIRLRREGSAEVEHLRVKTIRRWDGLRVAVQGETLQLTLRNTLPQALTGVEVVVHYEGCYGKPGAPSEAHPIGALAPGAEATVTAPLKLFREIGRGREHVPYSVQIRGEGAAFALDVPLRDLGPAAACSERGGGAPARRGQRKR